MTEEHVLHILYQFLAYPLKLTVPFSGFLLPRITPTSKKCSLIKNIKSPFSQPFSNHSTILCLHQQDLVNFKVTQLLIG